jgi:NtrC-family two-component system sensor histidine kinase KinB
MVVIHFARVVVAPIVEMTRVVQAIRRGDFSQRVTSSRDDETGRLSTGLSRMADELEEFRRTNIGEVIHAKETLEATLGAFPDAVLVIDEARNVSAANPRAQAVLPLPEGTLEAGKSSLETVDLTKTIEVTLSGQPRRLLPRMVPIADGRGAVLVLSDVTELARLDERRLELVAVASHELRTPLTTMRMTLSMLHEHAVQYNARDRELISTAMLGVEQLAALVDEFLDLTRIEAGQLRLHWTHVLARDLVSSTVKTATPAADQANVTLEVEHDPSTPGEVPGDPARMAMVVSNLLTNAIKYTPAGGRVLIRTSGTPGELTIEVSDTGPGIPAELRERVFERFFRVEHSQKSAPPSAGVGIGLYIARQVIELHGGTIRCDTGPLGGARVTVTIGKLPSSEAS